MPKEKINDDVTPGWFAEISWCPAEGVRTGHVQLASVATDSPFEFPEVVTADHYSAAERFDGWRVTLDEAGLTKLIRTLHKAKRQAFPKADTVDVHVDMPDGMRPEEAAEHVAAAINRVRQGDYTVEINEPVRIDLDD